MKWGSKSADLSKADFPFPPLFAFFLWSNSVLREADASMLLPSTSATSFTSLATESQPATSISKANLVPLAVGLTVGLVAVVVVVLCGACYLCRRRRTRGTPINPNLNAYPASPYTPSPIPTFDQQLSRSQDRKGHPQITRRSDVPMVTRPFAFSDLGPPPSYRSDVDNRSMGTSD